MPLTSSGSQLESILKEVEKVRSIVASKRKRHKLASFFFGEAHTAALKKCRDDLEWAMKEFEVSPSCRARLGYAV